MDIKRFTWDCIDSNMYVIKSGSKALVIDPIDSDAAFNYLADAEFVTVFLTHEHFDHICGLNRIRQEKKCIVYAQKICSDNIQNDKRNLSAYANSLMQIAGKNKVSSGSFVCKGVDIVFEKELGFAWEGYQGVYYATPGHSPGSACIAVENVVFTGDTLLELGSPNRLPGSSKKDYISITIPILDRIIDKTKTIYPGHGTPFTL